METTQGLYSIGTYYFSHIWSNLSWVYSYSGAYMSWIAFNLVVLLFPSRFCVVPTLSGLFACTIHQLQVSVNISMKYSCEAGRWCTGHYFRWNVQRTENHKSSSYSEVHSLQEKPDRGKADLMVGNSLFRFDWLKTPRWRLVMYRNMNDIEYIEIIDNYRRYQSTPAPENDRVLYVRQARTR